LRLGAFSGLSLSLPSRLLFALQLLAGDAVTLFLLAPLSLSLLMILTLLFQGSTPRLLRNPGRRFSLGKYWRQNL
jgi:hypothetical protein